MNLIPIVYVPKGARVNETAFSDEPPSTKYEAFELLGKEKLTPPKEIENPDNMSTQVILTSQHLSR
jgi:hypothetical protein